MKIAQELYEKGYITYHRTDSLNLSSQSLTAARAFIEKQFGKTTAWIIPEDLKQKKSSGSS